MATAFSENLTAEQQSQVLQVFQQIPTSKFAKRLNRIKYFEESRKKAVTYYALNYNCLLHGTLVWSK